MDEFRRLEQVPRRQQHGANCGDHPTRTEAYFLRRAVREIERRGDEVCHDIDADGGDDHGQQANRHRQAVAHVADGLDGVGDHFAEQRLRA